MNGYTDIKEWLQEVRFSRNVCMLIPMEASMGLPVTVIPGEEYLVPFFRVASTETTNRMFPPFAYLRIQYPSGLILTYNNLRRIPEWKNTDWNQWVECGENGSFPDGYDAFSDCHQTPQQQDVLLNSVRQLYAHQKEPVVWYEKLIEEAKKYR